MFSKFSPPPSQKVLQNHFQVILSDLSLDAPVRPCTPLCQNAFCLTSPGAGACHPPPYDEEPLPRETPEPSDEEDHRTSESENSPPDDADDADDSSDELERIPRPDIYTTYLSDQYIPSSPHPSTESGESSSSEQEEEHLATPEHQPHTTIDIRRGNPHRNPSSISRLGVAEDYIKGEEDWTASEEEEASIYNIIIDSLNVKPR